MTQYNDRVCPKVTDSQNYLDKILSLCKENKYIPVFVIPPCSRIMKQKLSDEFMNYAVYNILQQDCYKEIACLDYFHTNEFDNINLYMDTDYLNETGRKAFTKRVIEDLRYIQTE